MIALSFQQREFYFYVSSTPAICSVLLCELQKNSELEKENCDLAKQRDDLIKKCRAYQQEIEQHKHQGCMVPHFSPPFDLDQILNPATPPSPSFSESGPSLSPCPSPASSISPGPPPRHSHQTYHAELTPSAQVYDSTEVYEANGMGQTEALRGSAPGPVTLGMVPVPTTVTTLAPADLPECKQEPKQSQVHYLKVKNKDGSIKTLCLAHEDYLKVVQKVKAQKAAAAQQQHLMSERTQLPAATVTSASPSQQMPFMPQMKHDQEINMNTGLVQPQTFQHHAEPVQEELQSSGQKLDTFDDLISVLKNTVSDSKKEFELIPVNPNEVLVKQEPVDTEYEQQSFMTMETEPKVAGIKEEVCDLTHATGNNLPDSSGQWVSVGQQIRAGLDVLTNQNEAPSSNAHIENIINFLEKDDRTLTVTVTDPKTAQVLEQTTSKTNSVQPLGQPSFQQTTADSTSAMGQRITYITSSAVVGSLSMSKADSSSSPISWLQQSKGKPVTNMQKKVDANPRRQPQSISVSAMQNVKLRPHAVQLMAPTPGVPGKAQTTRQQVTATAVQPPQTISQQAQRSTASQNGVSVTLVASKDHSAPEKKLQRIINTSWSGNSAKTSQGMTGSLKLISSHNGALPQTEMSEPLLSVSTAQIMEYLQENSIESMDS